MPSSIDNYRKLMDQPWGKMFYDVLFRQLALPEDHPLDILDFGAGFCVTASHYAPFHRVTAIEPSKEMLDLKLEDHGSEYTCIHGGIEEVRKQNMAAFDLVICHNVLEYVPDKERILTELAGVLKKGGRLSIVKHNLAGESLRAQSFPMIRKRRLAYWKTAITKTICLANGIPTARNIWSNRQVNWV